MKAGKNLGKEKPQREKLGAKIAAQIGASDQKSVLSALSTGQGSLKYDNAYKSQLSLQQKRDLLGFQFANAFELNDEKQSKRNAVSSLSGEALEKQGQKFDSIQVCEGLAQTIVEKAGNKIRDKIIAQLAPSFAKKQLVV